MKADNSVNILWFQRTAYTIPVNEILTKGDKFNVIRASTLKGHLHQTEKWERAQFEIEVDEKYSSFRVKTDSNNKMYMCYELLSDQHNGERTTDYPI